MTAENFIISEVACDLNCCHKICDNNGRLDTNVITENTVEHLIGSEQAFRYKDSIQELYRHIRRNYKHIIAEDVIQRYVMMAHGIRASISDSELIVYRLHVRKFTHLPHIREKGFFLRNNIMVEGLCRVGSIVPDLKLHNYNANDIIDSYSTLHYWTQKATSENKTLVIFAGSIT